MLQQAIFLVTYYLKHRCIVSCHSRSQIPSLFLARPVSCKKELLRVTAAILSFSQLMTLNLVFTGTGCSGRQYAGVVCSRATPRRECVNSCGTGYFLNATEMKCLPCSSNCSNCSIHHDNCTACNELSFLFSASCARSCPEGYYGNLRSKKCERCHDTCRSCVDGWTNDHCSSCVEPYFLSKFS